jgi:CHAT domain-containing protein
MRSSSLPCALALAALAAAGLAACNREERAQDRGPPTPVPPLAAGEEVAPSTPAAAAIEDPAFEHALALRRDNRHQEAAEEYARLAADFAHAGEPRRRCIALLEWAYQQDFLGRREEARSVLPELAELAAGDAVLQSRLAHLTTMLLYREGRLAEALTEGERALALALEAGDPLRASQAYGVLSTVHSNSGRYHESLEVSERRVELIRRADLPRRELATASNSLGIDYRHFGRYGDAERIYEEALAAYRELGDDDGTAMVLFNLANIHSATGRRKLALALKLESLRLTEVTGNRFGLGMLHNDLAEIYRHAGNLPAARHHVERGLAVHRDAGNAYGEVLALEFRGRLELAEGKPAQAQETLRNALALADERGYGKEQAMARAVLARAAAAAGDAAEALSRAGEAVERARSLGDPQVEVEALEALGAAREAAGSPAAAAAYLEGVELLESWRGRLALGDLRMGVADPFPGLYEGAIRALLAAGREAVAFEVAERSRARLLLELMAERQAAREAPGEEPLEQRLRERYAARQRAPAERRQGIDRELEALTGQLEERRQQARALRPAAAAARHPEPASVAAIQAGLLGSGRALVAFFWGQRGVYGWALHADTVRAARLGAPDALAPRVEFLRSALEDPASEADWRGAARRLHDLLLAPLELAAAEELLIVADGPLAYLPFEALTPRPGGVPLGASRRLRYGPSASILLALAQAPAAPAGFERALLAVGNPAGAGGGGPRVSRQPSAVASVPLPHAELEARRIASRFRRSGADLLRGEAATREGWLALSPGRYRYLHFAVHGRLDEGAPGATHLVLADGPLGLSAIRGLDLAAELVTLSGCATALGPQVRGEGVVGLPHAFLAAGARAVLVSLWRVDDRHTAELMGDFYRELHAGTEPAEALRRVRRDWAGRPGPAGHPAHWAPFVLVGGLEPG